MVKRVLSDEVIVEILESSLNNAEAGTRYGVSRQCIQQIRHGSTYADVRPDIPRLNGKSCAKCQHWTKGHCTFEFPDPLEDGVYAARYCNLYLVSSP